MISKERNIESIELLIKEQAGILNEVRNTKAYKTVEGYHFLKEKKGINKIQNAKKVLNHICGQPNGEITALDPLETVFRLQNEIEVQLEQEALNLHEYVGVISILGKIWEAKSSGSGVISIFAPYEEINRPDGYSRRIKNIDDLLEKQMLRVYISKNTGGNDSLPVCSVEAENYISVKYNSFNREQCSFIALIAHLTGIAYIHSVYQAALPVARDKNIIKLYDFHGVVPEELMLMGKSKEAEYYTELESGVVQNSDYIIVANYAMEKHIESKYSDCKAEFIIFPMNNDDNNFYMDIEEKEEKRILKPIVIYSGGLQKWQLISEMQDAIEKMRNKCEFHLFVSEPNEFIKLWGDREAPEKWEVTTKTPKELIEEYISAQYGFVLRDDIVVNNVACPTKIIDYIKYNIIPIMKTPQIGDFKRYGLRYLSIDDFLEGNFPAEEERVKMCKKNQEILGKILEEYKLGREKIKSILMS